MVARVSSGVLCACGCGSETYLWTRTNATFGWRRGTPQRYLNGHNVKGRVLSEETKKKIGASHFKEKSVSWKGEEADYSAIHRWARKHFPKTGTCEHCQQESRTDWANIDHRYRRDREDWIELCRSCHSAFDGRGFQRKDSY